MFAAVASRARGIATQRAIGFRGLPAVVAVMLETVLLALIGGAIGCLAAWLLFDDGFRTGRRAQLQASASCLDCYGRHQVGHRLHRWPVPGRSVCQPTGDGALREL